MKHLLSKKLTFSQSSFYARLRPYHSATHRSILGVQYAVFGLAAAEWVLPPTERVAELVEVGPTELGDPAAAVEQLAVVL